MRDTAMTVEEALPHLAELLAARRVAFVAGFPPCTDMAVRSRGLQMHGFGVKAAGLAMYADALTSADSLAWSYGARQDARKGIRHCSKKTCANCLHYALRWRERLLSDVGRRQMALTFGGAA